MTECIEAQEFFEYVDAKTRSVLVFKGQKTQGIMEGLR